MDNLLKDIKSCTLCADFLPHGINPVLSASPKSKIAIIGQAPGAVVHESGIPWDDKSGERLRSWLNVSPDQFYDEEIFALIPMGFCYPGKGKSGDLPPRKECAAYWHQKLMEQLNELELVILIGTYALQYYIGDAMQGTLTETVQSFQDYLPKYFVLPHPSPRNNIWLKKNPWFEKENVPILQEIIKGSI